VPAQDWLHAIGAAAPDAAPSALLRSVPCLGLNVAQTSNPVDLPSTLGRDTEPHAPRTRSPHAAAGLLD
jgi:hypothetical protein